jgi:hypothetical protein
MINAQENNNNEPAVNKCGIDLIKIKLKEWGVRAGNPLQIDDKDDLGEDYGRYLVIENYLVIRTDEQDIRTPHILGDEDVTTEGFMLEIIVSTPAAQDTPPEEDTEALAFYGEESQVVRRAIVELFLTDLDAYIQEWADEEEEQAQEQAQQDWKKMAEEWDAAQETVD